MQIIKPQKKVFIFPFILLFIFLVYFFIYSQGLSGSFLLDDFGNLDKLGDFNGVRNLDTFIKYLSGGIAGPTGRPLSLLSFLANATNWPTDPFPFKLTNVLLHGLSGIFLYLLCQQLLLCFYSPSNQLNWAAVFATAAWLMHPFLVSTVLYVVQRMAMLSAFFSIIGLWLHIKGRHLLTTHPRHAYRLMSITLVICTFLAILSKENGVLLPLLIICVEMCVTRHPSTKLAPLNRAWQGLFLILPSLMILAYLIHEFNPNTLDHPFHGRSFTLPQRLLTESRLVTGYLYHLFIPQMYYPGLFNENIKLSTSIMSPPTTLYSLIGLTGLFTTAVFVRHRWPFFSLGILFFFAGHLLESTTLGLELYFEHRNYLPSIFLFLPFSSALVRFNQNAVKIGMILFLLICTIFTYQRGKLWGNPLELAVFSAQQNTQSSRAQRTAAIELENAGHPMAALDLLNKGKKNIPDSLDLQWHWFILKCLNDGVTPENIQEMNTLSGQLNYTSAAYNILQTLIQTIQTSECKGGTYQDALNILDALLLNPSVISTPHVQFQIHHLKGTIYSSHKQPELAMAEFDTVLKLNQNVEHGLVEIGILASNGYYAQALALLYKIEPLAKNAEQKLLSLNTKPEYSKELTRIKKSLLDELAK